MGSAIEVNLQGVTGKHLVRFLKFECNIFIKFI